MRIELSPISIESNAQTRSLQLHAHTRLLLFKIRPAVKYKSLCRSTQNTYNVCTHAVYNIMQHTQLVARLRRTAFAGTPTHSMCGTCSCVFLFAFTLWLAAAFIYTYIYCNRYTKQFKVNKTVEARTRNKHHHQCRQHKSPPTYEHTHTHAHMMSDDDDDVVQCIA